MTTWKSEIYRYAALALYWRDYRYKRPVRGTLLDYECDIFIEDLIADSPFGEEHVIGGDWLRRYFDGSICRKTGEYYFTTPREDRLDEVNNFIARSGILSNIMLDDHATTTEEN